MLIQPASSAATSSGPTSAAASTTTSWSRSFCSSSSSVATLHQLQGQARSRSPAPAPAGPRPSRRLLRQAPNTSSTPCAPHELHGATGAALQDAAMESSSPSPVRSRSSASPRPGHHWPHRRLRRHCAPLARPDNTSAPRSSNTLETKRPVRGASMNLRQLSLAAALALAPLAAPIQAPAQSPAQLRPLSDGRRQRPLQERPGRRPLRQLHPRRKRSRHRDRLHLHRAHRHHRADGSRLLQRRP